MEDEKKLYPLRFVSIRDEYDWGEDSFLLADLGYRDSYVLEGWLASNTLGEVMDTYMDRVVGDSVFGNFGRQFPVQVKRISVKGRMPLRVHPDREVARQRYDFLGRDKVWYVTRAGRDASVMLGFRHDTDASEVYEKCLDGTVGDILNVVAPHAGQLFHIKPGTPHAASGDIEILEISESSPLDFCMCGWGKVVSTEEFDPSLSLIDALDFIDYKAYTSDVPKSVKKDGIERLLALDAYALNRLELSSPLHSFDDQFDSFVLYSCLSGSAAVQTEVDGGRQSFRMKAGETMLVPAECQDFYLVPESQGTVILEVTCPDCREMDPYINPSAEPALPEEER